MDFIRSFDSLTLDDLPLVGGKTASLGEMIRELTPLGNPAVVRALEMAIAGAHRARCNIGICGQARSDYPEIAERLVRAGIDSLSLSPDVAVATRLRVAEIERRAH